MEPGGESEPLLAGRSSLRIEDFCLNTGLDRETAEELVRERLIDDSWWTWEEPSRLKSLFIEALPSRESLVALGLSIRDDYDPENLRYGGIECATHGWAPAVLLTRLDDDDRELPDSTMCWECSQGGVPSDTGNSIPLEPGTVERWRRTHDREGNWIGPDEHE